MPDCCLLKRRHKFYSSESIKKCYYKKVENERTTVELTYEYEYDEIGRKKVTKIADLITDNITIMEYEY